MGGDGKNTISVVPGVSVTQLGKKTYFNPYGIVPMIQRVTINYFNNSYEKIAESSTIEVKYFSGSSSEIVVTSPNIDGATPNEAYIKIRVPEEDTVNFTYTTERDSACPLTFVVISGGTITWRQGANATAKTISYSLNGGPWTEITSTTGGSDINVSKGDILRFKGNNTAYSNGAAYNYSNWFSGSAYFNTCGNIMSLVYGDDFADKKTLSSNATFSYLFFKAKIKDTSNIFMPATGLTNSCYTGMFVQCSGLTDGPKELPATTAPNHCYSYMFSGCTNLTYAPTLPATTLGNRCYMYMFYYCTKIETPPELPATVMQPYCYSNMFYGCSGLKTAPALPSTTLAQGCYSYMFSNCRGLTCAPVLPSETMASTCYDQMFSNCDNLNYIECNATGDISTSIVNLWVCGVSQTGVFIKNSGATWALGWNGIPYGWVTVNDKLALSVNKSNIKVFDHETTTVRVTVYNGFGTPWTATTSYGYISFDKQTSNDMLTDLYITISGNSSTRSATISIKTRVSSSQSYSTSINIEEILNTNNEYLTFDILEGGKVVWLAGSNDTSITRTISYKINNGSWTDITSNSVQSRSSFNVSKGDVVRFKGDNASYATNWWGSSATTFSGTTAKFNVYGNIMSLIDSTGFSTAVTLTSAFTFDRLFLGVRGLIDAKGLVLPATTLTDFCYGSMFSGCTSLENGADIPEALGTSVCACCYYMYSYCDSLLFPPDLQMKALGERCYYGMFEYCRSLKETPEIYPDVSANTYSFLRMFYHCDGLKTIRFSAMTLAASCCTNMFSYCIGLTEPNTTLPAINLQPFCYENMFSNCKNLIVTPELPSTNLASNCYRSMFSGCTSLTRIPELPATTLAASCYTHMFECCLGLVDSIESLLTTGTVMADACCSYMFSGCTNLKKMPTLLPKTLARMCYSHMFEGCTSLSENINFCATTLANACFHYMFSGCYSLKNEDIPPLTYTTLAPWCYVRMFEKCSGLTCAPELPATNLTDNCYAGMFADCTSLVTPPHLPATKPTYYCYESMFAGCTSLTTAPSINLTAVSSYCCAGMFMGCTNLVNAPILSGMSFVNGQQKVFQSMFAKCTSLTIAPKLPQTTLLYGCYAFMFCGCTSLLSAPELPATTLTDQCYSGMFYNCSSLSAVTCLATNISASGCLTNWLSGVSSSGTFTKAAAMSSWPTGVNGIPDGWTVQDATV